MAVADGVAVERLYLYEPPFRFDENQPAPPADLPARRQALLDGGDAGAVAATFQIEWVGLPQEVVNDARRSPMWAQFETMAQSAVYDAVITTDLQRPTAEMAAVSTPTLVLQGDPTWPVLATAAAAIARQLPNATHRSFERRALTKAPNLLTAWVSRCPSFVMRWSSPTAAGSCWRP